MYRYTWILLTVVALFCPAIANAFTISFDEVSAGSTLYYYNTYVNGVGFGEGFVIADHSTYTWGPPNSGTNVLGWNGANRDYARIVFGYSAPSEGNIINAQRVGAYFSTAPGVVVRMTGYKTNNDASIVDVLIGSSSESWNNKYVELYSATGDIDSIQFDAVSSPDARLGFWMDDLTITPVPEPSSLAALTLGILPLAGCALRRRIKC